MKDSWGTYYISVHLTSLAGTKVRRVMDFPSPNVNTKPPIWHPSPGGPTWWQGVILESFYRSRNMTYLHRDRHIFLVKVSLPCPTSTSATIYRLTECPTHHYVILHTLILWWRMCSTAVPFLPPALYPGSWQVSCYTSWETIPARLVTLFEVAEVSS